MAPDHWRKALHTFADENRHIYTVTNVPPIIPHLATAIDPESLVNSSTGTLQRPQVSIRQYPELPFLLRTLPVGDPLLSRLCVNPAKLTPTHYEGGWALADDIRNAWIRLEKGLLYVSEMLLTSSEQSACGTSARYAIRDHSHWPHPEDHGYRKLHGSARSAEISIRRAHLAFQLLVARCSLAIAIWLFPGPVGGTVPEVSSSHYDYASDQSVPDWVAFLKKKEVPSSWIDAISDSTISDFSLNLRVGTIFDPSNCDWLAIAPVLRAANVPVFVLWRGRDEINTCAALMPFMMSFAPPSPRDVHLALERRPAGKPRIVTLCREGQSRPLPDFSAVDDTTPPFGPYQLPGESRSDFFARRERFRPDQERQETQRELNWRRERVAHAQTALAPSRHSRLYLWVNAKVIFPELPPRWDGCEYRHPIPPSAYRSIWMVHPPGYRQYNSFFDEWDLWFPPGWEDTPDETSETHPAWSILVPSHPPRRATTIPSDSDAAARQAIAHILHDDEMLLNPTPEDRDIHDVGLPPNYHLCSWYGITMTEAHAFPEVDYQTWANRLPQIFSEQATNLPDDPAIRASIAGWTSAMFEGDRKSRALESTWDLDKRNPSYLLHDPNLRMSISLEHHRAPKHVFELDNISRWVLVRFHKDPDNQSWSLLTSAMGALLLARRLDEAETSQEALSTLVSVGVPVRTAIVLTRCPCPIFAIPSTSRRRFLPPWRKQGERETVQNYYSYCQRVLEISQRPHARAAWMKGGIVWRIMRHVTGREGHMRKQGELIDGPSYPRDHCHPVTEAGPDGAYYDDGLTIEELDVIAGVVKVYTGNRSQTEDASWWPKHSAWVRGGAYTGIWTTWQEHWFQMRLKKIYDGDAKPLNATEWKDTLKAQKKAGQLAELVDQASWEFTYRHFVQAQEQS
ncbi:hypothetical protein LXA43DRAFT_1097196 [Ganoderma leucocontextum]|nr:hypothetical protein LXA43DRAFT_1097196 [Ganoderma leucocontextum]